MRYEVAAVGSEPGSGSDSEISGDDLVAADSAALHMGLDKNSYRRCHPYRTFLSRL